VCLVVLALPVQLERLLDDLAHRRVVAARRGAAGRLVAWLLVQELHRVRGARAGAQRAEPLCLPDGQLDLTDGLQGRHGRADVRTGVRRLDLVLLVDHHVVLGGAVEQRQRHVLHAGHAVVDQLKTVVGDHALRPAIGLAGIEGQNADVHQS
jgi:hypothetical protein